MTDPRFPLDRKTDDTVIPEIALALDSVSPRIVLGTSTMTDATLQVMLIAEFSQDGGRTWTRTTSTHCGGREVFEDDPKGGRRVVRDAQGNVVRVDGVPVDDDGTPIEIYLSFQVPPDYLKNTPLFRGWVKVLRGELTTDVTVKRA